uniref:Uncharacterized protein n=1 Tax=Arundo donax TaxID=35708 RepID=A0A0A9ARI3_ARUDO
MVSSVRSICGTSDQSSLHGY